MSNEKCTNREKNFDGHSLAIMSNEKCTNREKISQKFFFDFLKKTLAKVFSVGIIGRMKST